MDKSKIAFLEQAIKNRREAYLAISNGAVSEYHIGSRTIRYEDLPGIYSEIQRLEADLAREKRGNKIRTQRIIPHG